MRLKQLPDTHIADVDTANRVIREQREAIRELQRTALRMHEGLGAQAEEPRGPLILVPRWKAYPAGYTVQPDDVGLMPASSGDDLELPAPEDHPGRAIWVRPIGGVRLTSPSATLISPFRLGGTTSSHVDLASLALVLVVSAPASQVNPSWYRWYGSEMSE